MGSVPLEKDPAVSHLAVSHAHAQLFAEPPGHELGLGVGEVHHQAGPARTAAPPRPAVDHTASLTVKIKAARQIRYSTPERITSHLCT
jgi:hypothetical protein